MENRINIACFNEGSRTAEVKDIWQWDYGQILRIQALNLPTAVEIHFSLDEHGGEAVRRIGVTKDGVTDVPIPDLMVENESAYGDSYYFFAYIYLTDETSGNTEYKIRAKVSTRSKPEGYNSGDSTFAAILKTVNDISSDKVDVPESAKVGQVLAVKATDESGKPTEFEATDQGGGVSDEKIAEAVGTYMESHPIEETDPTVSDWAKQPEKPSYTASEVGALPNTTKIPSKTSDLQNDSGFLTEHQDLSDYALKSEVPKSASDVGADASGTAENKVSEHNISDTAHNDIRLLIDGLTTRLNTLADSDDETLDQMSEVVAYIKSNKSLIDAITTSKVSVSDIIDNLTTNVSNKPLSAAQGVALKALIDGITIPEKLPNPQKLTFSGAVTAEYDGSGAVTVKIPEGSGGSGGSEYELLCDQSFDLDGTGTPIELSLPASPKGFVLYLGIQVDSPATSDTMTFSVDGATVPSYFNLFNLTTSKVTVKKWFCDNIVTHNLTYFGSGDANTPQTSIAMVRGKVEHVFIGNPKGDGKLVVGVPTKAGTLHIRAYMRY